MESVVVAPWCAARPWTAPAIVIATAAPAFARHAATGRTAAATPSAASTRATARRGRSPTGCNLRFLNGTDATVTVNITGLTWRGVAPTYPPHRRVRVDERHVLRPACSACPTVPTPALWPTAASRCRRSTFTIGPATGGTPGETCAWIFWRGDASAQNDMCFTYTYQGSRRRPATCHGVHHDPLRPRLRLHDAAAAVLEGRLRSATRFRDPAGMLTSWRHPVPDLPLRTTNDPPKGGSFVSSRAPVLGSRAAQLALLIMPAPTVTPVASSMRMNEPVVRFFE